MIRGLCITTAKFCRFRLPPVATHLCPPIRRVLRKNGSKIKLVKRASPPKKNNPSLKHFFCIFAGPDLDTTLGRGLLPFSHRMLASDNAHAGHLGGVSRHQGVITWTTMLFKRFSKRKRSYYSHGVAGWIAIHQLDPTPVRQDAKILHCPTALFMDKEGFLLGPPRYCYNNNVLDTRALISLCFVLLSYTNR